MQTVELYQMGRPGQALVMDEETNTLYLRKTLQIYNRNVYEWIMEHPDPHIPRIYSVNEDDGQLTVLEEYITGKTLEELLETEPLSAEEGAHIAEEICDGLAYLHSADPPIIHRDIKASNVLLSEDGAVRLIDFDAAKLYTPGTSRDTQLIGTVGSAAPEQYGFGASDVRTDVYGLGVLLARLCPGDKNMLRVAKRACSMDPSDRYQTIMDMKTAIESGSDPDRRLQPPPGFRSKSLFRKIMAGIGYFLIFGTALTWPFEPAASIQALWGERLVLLFTILSIIGIFGGWPEDLKKLPFMKSRWYLRIPAGLLYSVLAFILWLAVYFVIMELFGFPMLP